MHYRGNIWRPPFEANSALLQVTSGCTHNKCRFCSLYDVDFRMSPMNEIEADLRELEMNRRNAERVFMTGANPLVLSAEKLCAVIKAIHRHLPNVHTVGGFARITDILSKSPEELRALHRIGLDGISIGTESGDDDVLRFMQKGYTTSDIVKGCKKLEAAGISYNITYLTGLAGRGKGGENALESAKVYNLLRPQSINVVALTVFPESDLYTQIRQGSFAAEGEKEMLAELYTFIGQLNISTVIYANTVSNAAPFSGIIPKDKQKILGFLKKEILSANEEYLQNFRNNIDSL